MLYWDRIRTLHGVLIDEGIRPEQSTITTNGRSLTDDYVEYANANPDIFTVVSWHDGNFTDEQLSRIFRLKEFSISLLIHHFKQICGVRETSFTACRKNTVAIRKSQCLLTSQ